MKLLLHLHLLLLARVDSLRMVRVVRMEVISRSDLIGHRHRRGAEDFFLHGCLLLFLLE